MGGVVDLGSDQLASLQVHDTVQVIRQKGQQPADIAASWRG